MIKLVTRGVKAILLLVLFVFNILLLRQELYMWIEFNSSISRTFPQSFTAAKPNRELCLYSI